MNSHFSIWQWNTKIAYSTLRILAHVLDLARYGIYVVGVGTGQGPPHSTSRDHDC